MMTAQQNTAVIPVMVMSVISLDAYCHQGLDEPFQSKTVAFISQFPRPPKVFKHQAPQPVYTIYTLDYRPASSKSLTPTQGSEPPTLDPYMAVPSE